MILLLSAQFLRLLEKLLTSEMAWDQTWKARNKNVCNQPYKTESCRRMSGNFIIMFSFF